MSGPPIMEPAAGARASLTSGSPPARPRWLRADLYPFESHYRAIDGGWVHYLDEGPGAPLLMLHGNPTWSFVYRSVIAGLRDSFRCIAPDLPGFGLSPATSTYDFTPQAHARIIERLVLDLDLRDIVLMVQDWGGPVGLWVAARHPDRFRGLVIGNTFAWPVNGDPHFERFSRLMGGPIGHLLIRHFNAFVNVLVPAGVRRHRVPPEVMAAYRGPFPTSDSREPTWIFPRAITRSREFLEEVRDGLVALRELPTLILWGDRDIAFRAQERERFEAAFQRSKTVVLGGAGHYIQEDAPDEIVQAVRAWADSAPLLQRTAPSPAAGGR